MSRSAVYRLWQDIKQRCRRSKWYEGLSVGFYSFEEFAEEIAKLGDKPDVTYTLDRINPLLGYIPGNLRWADKKTQTKNRILGFTKAERQRMRQQESERIEMLADVPAEFIAA